MDIVAHRGYSGKYPENSPLAFERALQLPIHGIECDVRLTRDGKVVIHHDASLNRTSNGSGYIGCSDWEDLRGLNIGTEENPQRMMLLDDLLDMLGDRPHDLYIETKQLGWQGSMLEEALVLRLRYRGLLDDPRVHVISFSHRSIRRMARLAPDVDRIYLRKQWETRWNRPDILLSDPRGLGLSLTRGKLMPAMIGKGGLRTYMWTVDKPDDMRWAWGAGVDILATNEPERALDAIGY